MKSTLGPMGKVILAIASLLLASGLALASPAADRPLSADDVTLLLLGSSPSDKIMQVVQQRGVNFQMNPELAKKLHDLGASDALIDALRQAGSKPAAAPAASTPPPSAAPTDSTAKPNAPATSADAPVTQGHAGGEASSTSTETPTATQQAPPAASPAATPPALSETAAEQKVRDTIDRLTRGEDAPPAPILRLQDISGRKLGPDDFKGKVVLVNYWATWCPPCKAEVPSLVRLQGAYRSEGLQVVGIAVDDTARKVREFARDNGINYPVIVGDATLKTLFGDLGGVPTSFLIGRDGRVYYKINGAPMDASAFEQGIKMLLKAPADRRQEVASAAAPPPPPASPARSGPVLKVAAGASAPPSSTSSSPSAATTSAATTTNSPGLADPNPAETKHIVEEFAAKEKIFRQARDNYTYHQINKVQELGTDNEVVGSFQQEWDILYDDAGKRIERVTYAPTPSLKGLIVTKEDIENFRSIQPFVLTTDELPEYDVKYLGHVKVDQITAYVFSLRPKEIQKNRLYFQGVVWVDDRDLQIVKTEGKTVPEMKEKHGSQNLFPHFTTWREQIDGKFWFPTYTLADDTLYFENGPPVHMKEIVRYTDYKQFKSGVRILSVEQIEKDKDQNKPPAEPKK